MRQAGLRIPHAVCAAVLVVGLAGSAAGAARFEDDAFAVDEGIEVCGALTESTVWRLVDSPVHVTCDVTVPEGLTLTIEPGVVVQLSAPTTNLIVDGRLDVAGAEGAPVTFQPSGAQAPGSWGRVRIDRTGNATIAQAVLEYGGHEGGTLYTEGALELLDSVVRYSATPGLIVNAGAPLVRSTRFEGNTVECAGYGAPNFSNGAGIQLGYGSVTVEDSVFEGNSATRHNGCPDTSAFGGAISVWQGGLTLRRSEFRNNWAQAEGSSGWAMGGAVSIGNQDGTIATLEENTFEGNWVSALESASGNAVHATASEKKIIRGNTFVSNGSPPAPDPNVRVTAAVYLGSLYVAEITDNVFRNNAGAECAALYAGPDSMVKNNTFDGNLSEFWTGAVCAKERATVEGNTFVNNVLHGTGVYPAKGAGLWCTGCTAVRGNRFVGNQNPNGHGGGMYVDTSALVENNWFEANMAQVGGGLYAGSVSMTVQNNIFRANDGNGSAIYLFFNASEHAAVIRHNTFWGGGIPVIRTSYNTPGTMIVSNIFASSASAGAIWGYGPPMIIDYNTYWDETIPDPVLIYGPHDIAADPLFADPAGGDFHLGLGSPCIDSADPGSDATTDFEGDTRPLGPGPDMGADEAPAGTGPAAKPVLAIARQGADLALSWTTDARNAGYALWRGGAPDVTPETGDAVPVSDGTGPECTAAADKITCLDVGAPRDPAQGHFYVVRALTAVGAQADSNRAGEVSFALVGGE